MMRSLNECRSLLRSRNALKSPESGHVSQIKQVPKVHGNLLYLAYILDSNRALSRSVPLTSLSPDTSESHPDCTGHSDGAQFQLIHVF